MLLLNRALWTGLLLGLLGCGYRLVRPSLPPEVASVYVPVFRNQTAEPGAEAAFTDALRRALAHGGVLVGTHGSDTLAEGEVLFLGGGQNVAYAGAVLRYRVSGSVRIRMVREGLVLRQATINGFEDYTPGPNVLSTEANRQAAVQRLADSMMQDAYEELTAAP